MSSAVAVCTGAAMSVTAKLGTRQRGDTDDYYRRQHLIRRFRLG